MRKLRKSLAWLLVVALTVSLLAGVTLSAAAAGEADVYLAEVITDGGVKKLAVHGQADGSTWGVWDDNAVGGLSTTIGDRPDGWYVIRFNGAVTFPEDGPARTVTGILRSLGDGSANVSGTDYAYAVNFLYGNYNGPLNADRIGNTVKIFLDHQGNVIGAEGQQATILTHAVNGGLTVYGDPNSDPWGPWGVAAGMSEGGWYLISWPTANGYDLIGAASTVQGELSDVTGSSAKIGGTAYGFDLRFTYGRGVINAANAGKMVKAYLSSSGTIIGAELIGDIWLAKITSAGIAPYMETSPYGPWGTGAGVAAEFLNRTEGWYIMGYNNAVTYVAASPAPTVKGVLSAYSDSSFTIGGTNYARDAHFRLGYGQLTSENLGKNVIAYFNENGAVIGMEMIGELWLAKVSSAGIAPYMETSPYGPWNDSNIPSLISGKTEGYYMMGYNDAVTYVAASAAPTVAGTLDAFSDSVVKVGGTEYARDPHLRLGYALLADANLGKNVIAYFNETGGIIGLEPGADPVLPDYFVKVADFGNGLALRMYDTNPGTTASDHSWGDWDKGSLTEGSYLVNHDGASMLNVRSASAAKAALKSFTDDSATFGDVTLGFAAQFIHGKDLLTDANKDKEFNYFLDSTGALIAIEEVEEIPAPPAPDDFFIKVADFGNGLALRMYDTNPTTTAPDHSWGDWPASQAAGTYLAYSDAGNLSNFRAVSPVKAALKSFTDDSATFGDVTLGFAAQFIHGKDLLTDANKDKEFNYFLDSTGKLIAVEDPGADDVVLNDFFVKIASDSNGEIMKMYDTNPGAQADHSWGWWGGIAAVQGKAAGNYLINYTPAGEVVNVRPASAVKAELKEFTDTTASFGGSTFVFAKEFIHGKDLLAEENCGNEYNYFLNDAGQLIAVEELDAEEEIPVTDDPDMFALIYNLEGKMKLKMYDPNPGAQADHSWGWWDMALDPDEYPDGEYVVTHDGANVGNIRPASGTTGTLDSFTEASVVVDGEKIMLATKFIHGKDLLTSANAGKEYKFWFSEKGNVIAITEPDEDPFDPDSFNDDYLCRIDKVNGVKKLKMYDPNPAAKEDHSWGFWYYGWCKDYENGLYLMYYSNEDGPYNLRPAPSTSGKVSAINGNSIVLADGTKLDFAPQFAYGKDLLTSDAIGDTLTFYLDRKGNLLGVESGVVLLEGDNQTYYLNSEKDISVRSSGEFDTFTGVVTMDGAVVDPANYTAKKGSTIITFKAAYLSTLSVGKHKFTIEHTNGTARGTLIVSDKQSPKTGAFSAAILMALSAAGSVAPWVPGKKKFRK